MKLSIVATLYNSEPYITEFYNRVKSSAEKVAGSDYEIILVNDGSPDNSLNESIKLTELDSHITVIDLSRNFGHHKAMMTGLAHSSGGKVFLIDSDLEEEPEWMENFLRVMLDKECDVVYGVQSQRKGNLFEQISGKWFYQFSKILTGMELPANVVTARLMTRRYVNALLEYKEREVFLAGLWYITGFLQIPCNVTKHSTSKTTYTFRRKISILVNSVTSFSNAPLRGIFYIGIAISSTAGLYTLFLIINWLFLSTPLSGWTSVMASIWLLGGLVISFIGVVGIYLAKIYTESKRRPYTIVRQIYGKEID